MLTKMIETLKKNPRTIVFTEGTDNRILDAADKLTTLQCLPDSLAGRRYYEPTEEGLEAKYKARLETIKAWKEEHRQRHEDSDR